jgi:hypothetical protein
MTKPSHSIYDTGPLGPGTAAGINRSINLLKSIKDTSTSASEPNSSINELRNWFRDNVGSQGLVTDTLVAANNTTVSMDDWHGVLIYGMILKVRNEKKNGSYWNGNNGFIQFLGVYGDQKAYRFTVAGTSKTGNWQTNINFNKLNVGASNGGTKTYTCSMEAAKDTGTIITATKEEFQIKLFSTSGTSFTPQLISFGTNNVTIDLGANNGNSFTTAKEVYIGKQ